MRIQYQSSVYTPAGWRSIRIDADATQVSPGFAKVARVTAINGKPPTWTMSRTGARRQEFSGFAVAEREIGARKRLSACTII